MTDLPTRTHAGRPAAAIPKAHPAQVGNGRTVHQVANHQLTGGTLCGRTASRLLTDAEAAKKNVCTRCAKAAARDQVRLMPDQARTKVAVVYPQAQDFRSCHNAAGLFLGYTFQSAPTRSARFGWITNAGTFSKSLEFHRSGAEELLPSAILDDERTELRRATLRDEAAARLAGRPQVGPFKTGDLVVCADRVTFSVQDVAPAVTGEPDRVIVDSGAQRITGNCLPAETASARQVLEGVIVQHDGATEGSSPRHAGHPDVAAARRALDGLAVARLTDRHDIAEPAEEEREVRGYVIEPRGQGRVALYWMEGGKLIRRDTPLHGAAIDCLEDRMRRQGWDTEPLRRSSQCLFAHVPQDQRQG
ncbi:hypothetical protein [Streptomyces sp. A5-4]|uniref:hypothetical protein n=1 Tax=Streptomyces sp. A5-4 TaxID=3384771 RepID=UPI003DA979EB